MRKNRPSRYGPTPRKIGRPKHDRVRAMRFALWAQHVSPDLLTAKQIAGLLDLHKESACKWRRDWLLAISPVEIYGIPAFVMPNPRALPFANPAATGQATPTNRS